MRVRSLLGLVLVLLGAGVCVRLGFWQLTRWEQKKRMNAELRSAAAAPPVEAGAAPPPLERLAGRWLALEGRYDESRQVLLAGRARSGSPGVGVVTPLILAGGGAVLVDRGWLPSPDAARARPQDYPEPGRVRVVGPVEPIPRTPRSPPWRTLDSGAVSLWSALALDPDSAASRFPYRLAPYVLRQAPGPGIPALPARRGGRRHDEAMHIGYAVQWFVFAAILLGGSIVVARRGRRPVSGWRPR